MRKSRFAEIKLLQMQDDIFFCEATFGADAAIRAGRAAKNMVESLVEDNVNGAANPPYNRAGKKGHLVPQYPRLYISCVAV